MLRVIITFFGGGCFSLWIHRWRGGVRLEQTLIFLKMAHSEECNLYFSDGDLVLHKGLRGLLSLLEDENGPVLSAIDGFELCTTDDKTNSISILIVFVHLHPSPQHFNRSSTLTATTNLGGSTYVADTNLGPLPGTGK